MARSLKKTKVKLDLLTNIDMLLMAEKGIRDRISFDIHQYAKQQIYKKLCHKKL